uniref:Biogenesis of lysosome-related organelles complex 1 subunit 1 n=2 Tax=Opuntia streptacantha TaxID=393608 RepID=A0A7C9AB28_OPUST
MNRRSAAGDPSPGGLEASLVQLVHHHQLSSAALRQQTEKAKKEAMRAGLRVSELVVDAVNGGVQESFLNQKRIESEIRSLSATISRFHKHTDQWLAASRALNTAIKEIGDFENWIKVMEYDCKSITAAIRNIHHA